MTWHKQLAFHCCLATNRLTVSRCYRRRNFSVLAATVKMWWLVPYLTVVGVLSLMFSLCAGAQTNDSTVVYEWGTSKIPACADADNYIREVDDVRSKLECASRCAQDEMCANFKSTPKTDGGVKCILIGTKAGEVAYTTKVREF